MRGFVAFVVVVVTCLSTYPLVSAETIYLPSEVTLSGTILVAESFYETVEDVLVPLQFQAWPGSHGMRDADWFDVRIEAHPGDLIVLTPGLYKVDLWVFTPQITITTEPNTEEIAEIWGTVEIDADKVTLDRIAVTGPRKQNSSGHGIEVNREVIDRITIRNCHIEENEWTGIHIIGPRGEISELLVEDCRLIANGMDGMDAQSVENLIITGCTITDNGWNLDQGVGVRIGSYVENIKMHDNLIAGNRFADVYRKE